MKRKFNLEGITIKEFVNYYLGVNHSCKNLRHQGLKSFNNPYVVGVSNDFALKYPEYVSRQELLIVIDSNRNPGTYINPENIEKLVELEICKRELKLLENVSCHSFTNINDLYSVWMELTHKINYLESMYGRIYELLFMAEKERLLRDIRKYAKREAKLLFISNPSQLDLYQDINLITYYENPEISSEDSMYLSNEIDNYEVTEKVNRQKQLSYYRKIS